MPRGGFEPPRPCGPWILSPLRLPFRHLGVPSPRHTMAALMKNSERDYRSEFGALRQTYVFGGDERIRTADRGFADPRLNHLATSPWSGRRDSNSRPSPWQGDALPLSHFRVLGAQSTISDPATCCRGVWCRGGDLNSYGLSPTAPSRQRVYRFHHLGPRATDTGRSGGTRTPDRRFWRPLLYQTELHSSAATSVKL